INLEENRSLLNAEQRGLLGGRYQVYRGDIAGMPKSWVRLVIADEVPRGMLWDGTEFWAIEVARDASTNVDSAFMYRLGDLQIAPGALSCAEIGVTKNGGEFAKAIMSEISANAAQGPGATSQIDVAVIGDFEFTSDKGANTNAAMVTRINNVDGIFSMQLGVQFNVGRIDTFASNNDPFTDQLDAGTLLEELSDYRNATTAQNANGLSHLFTGRDLDTTTVGIAWTEALCNRRFGASVTQATHSVTTDSLIAAHEFGHNFGAPHDGASGEACESETGDFLMATSINGSDQFSSCSITQMQDDVAGAACITPLPSTDVTLVAGGQPGMVLLGDSATVSFDANSVGTDTANDVTVDVTIPAGVTLSSVSTTAGNCTSGAGSASCAIGTITAGSGATVTLTATTSTVGSATFDATITANIDANANNNQAAVQFDIDPAVDMISTAAATAQVALNGSTIIRPSVRNSSSITATDVTVTLTPGAGINIDSASWSPGTCSIASNVATCDASSLAVQSTNTLQIGVTGTNEG
ncbi:MAG: M12 family metallo-peptidase, partial [Woeseiaceae bacterium]